MSQRPAQQKSVASVSDQGKAQEVLERTRNPARVMALTDGIFAVIVTLLVFEIKVPQLPAGKSLPNAFLLEVWPNVLIFVISFVYTGLFWMAHRDMFNLVRGVDRGLILLNFLYLLPMAMIPYAASLLSAFSGDTLALRLYGLLLLLIALMRLTLWLYIGTHAQLLYEDVDRRTLRSGALQALTLILLSLIAVLFAAFAPGVTLAIYAGVPVLYFIAVTFMRQSAPKGSQERNFT
jgi:TMEM175 potassium channel family protein